MTIERTLLRTWCQQRLAGGQFLVAVLTLAALTLSFVATGPGVLPGDVAFTRWVQRAPDGSIGTFLRVVNAIGETPVMLAIGAVLAFICWQRHRLDAMLLIAAASMSRIANPMLKGIFASPRPTPNLVHVDHISSGWGFPSGHVMGMTLLVGSLACLAWDTWPRRRTRIATLAIAGTILLASGAGRIYVGAHWPTDVLGAYLYGSLGTIALAWSWRHRLAIASIRPRRSLTASGFAVPDLISKRFPTGAATIDIRRRRISTVALGGFLALMIVFASMTI
jgi:membrane-associated phospholipid phosphatase